MKRIETIGKGHRSHLSIGEIADGISCILQNALDLIEDAELLLEHGRVGRALALAIHGLEEVGKITVLVYMADISPKRQKEFRGRWRQFRSHLEKSARGAVGLWDDETRTDLHQLLMAASIELATGSRRESARQLGMYIECASDSREWISPADLDTEEAKFLIVQARAAWDRQRQIADAGLYSEAALKLRQEIYAPYFDDLYERLPSEPEAADIAPLIPEIKAKHREYFERCRAIGIEVPTIGLEDETQS